MKRRAVLSQRLIGRIVTEVKKGVAADVAARKVGIDLGTWATWLGRKGRLYRALQAQVDQAEAFAEAEYVATLRKLAKGGKTRAVQLWLQSRAPERFPPRRNVNIGTLNTTLIQAIKEMERPRQLRDQYASQLLDQERRLLRGETLTPEEIEARRYIDPRELLTAEEQAREAQDALPPAPSEDVTPEPERVYEVNGETVPGILEMASVPK